MNVSVFVADYTDEQHAREISALLDGYARDPMGGGQPLDPHVVQILATELAKLPHAFTVLCYADGTPAGLANCFMGFSTFKCKPLINIHDLYVASEFRGHGLSQQLLTKVEETARERGCCKITLEVLDGNEPAKQAYLKFGFSSFELDPAIGQALLWEKPF